MASQNGHKDVCELLLNRGVDVGLTTLHLASEYGHKDVCSLLLDRGAGVNVRNAWGRTPLHALVAGLFSKKDYAYAICELLINRGADLNVKDKDGCTPLHGAVTASKELCELFIDNGESAQRLRRACVMKIQDGDNQYVMAILESSPEFTRMYPLVGSTVGVVEMLLQAESEFLYGYNNLALQSHVKNYV
jgi:ankyrin repeat protein